MHKTPIPISLCRHGFYTSVYAFMHKTHEILHKKHLVPLFSFLIII